MTPPNFEPPRALDLLTEFRKRYIPAIERGVMSGTIDPNVLDYFDRELNRMISAFIHEATKPFHDILVSAAMRSAGPMSFTEAEPPINVELWRGRCRGVWYRVVLANNYNQIRFETSFNASLGEEHEVWSVEEIR